MLKPKHVSSYAPTLNEVVTDFVKRVAWLKETSGDGVTVHDLAGELYKFAFEGQRAYLGFSVLLPPDVYNQSRIRYRESGFIF